MDSFQAEVGWKSMRKGENKNYRSVPFLPDAQQKIPKKQQKNSKNTIMDSFQSKINWKMMRKRENINYCSVSILPDT